MVDWKWVTSMMLGDPPGPLKENTSATVWDDFEAVVIAAVPVLHTKLTPCADTAMACYLLMSLFLVP
jgi:hypothetical protein